MKVLIRALTVVFLVVFAAAIAWADIYDVNGRDMVTDQADMLAGSRAMTRVKDAVSRLNNLGADAHVVLISSYGSLGTLDAYEEQLRSRVREWQGTNGLRKNNLLLFIVSLNDHQTGVYFGEQWNSPLKEQWAGIIAKYANPSFKRGEFSEGIVSGLDEIGKRIDAYLNPVTTSGFAGVFMWLIVIVAVLAVAFFVFRTFVQKKRARERALAVQRKAQMAKQTVNNVILAASKRLSAIEGLADAVINSLGGNDKQTLEMSLANVRQQKAELVASSGSISSSSSDPDTPGLSEAEYQVIFENVEKLSAQKVGPLVKAIEEFVSDIENWRNLVMILPTKVAEAKTTLSTDTSEVDKVEGKGFTVSEARALLVQAGEHIRLAEDKLASKEHSAANSELEEANVLSLQASKLANSYVSDEAEIAQSLASLPLRVEEASGMIAKGRQA